MTFKVGIVSSFDVLCGNATYSEEIVNGLSSTVNTVKIKVPIEIQRNRDVKVEESILAQVADCDAVNIQMELGLYGPHPAVSARFIKKMIRRAKHVSLTMHRVEREELNTIRGMYARLKQNDIIGAFKLAVKASVAKYYRQIITCGYRCDATFLVHTYREKNRILKLEPNANVVVHPIAWPENYCIDGNEGVGIADTDGCHLIKDDLPSIGLFGFTSDYKNFLQVVRVALTHKDYRIVIAGGTHPQSPDYGQKISNSTTAASEVEQISEIFMKLSSKRKKNLVTVHSPSDPELVKLIKDVDIVAVPYTETGQSAMVSPVCNTIRKTCHFF